ncbi:hypothetical protein EIN_407300 [Entamoeba invadens IP1]|uniref:HTH myb-type domain-containing protein n=1 Tax=Entamoeba invadens IP1 TaxID=370355 RepID=A0A0A1TWJ8_ENTIV|nr:hypothetical protein EIN_407300 [Entamoeba invadens IP1]ELP85551.1 hypothetical protein EIN_407300 [Entamoeba invadens IP1]|eukprot:XP_004184897.1 hypothetical protein EIN_407300 [Entamoeba invadens IP1]
MELITAEMEGEASVLPPEYAIFLSQSQSLANLEIQNQHLRHQMVFSPQSECQMPYTSSLSDCGGSQYSLTTGQLVHNYHNIHNNGGRRYWSSEEHILFLKAITWLNATSTKQLPVKLISEFVRTRTPVQVRTHAQKYFESLKKTVITQHKTSMTSDVVLDQDDIDRLNKLKENATHHYSEI